MRREGLVGWLVLFLGLIKWCLLRSCHGKREYGFN